MDVFGRDALIGDYRLSDHGLLLATFNFQDSYNLGYTMESNKTYLGKNPKPVYVGSKPNAVLELTMTVIQDEPKTGRDYFTVNECREFLGKLTGFQGYKRLYPNKESMLENVYYNVHVTDADYEKSGDKVVGIKLTMECDSPFAWVDKEFSYVTTSDNETITVRNNSDLFYDYTLPVITVKSDVAISGFEITNVTDNNRATMIDEVKANELITIDSVLSKITSTMNTNYSEIFNYKFPRLVRGENEIVISHPTHVTFRLALPRKIGVL